MNAILHETSQQNVRDGDLPDRHPHRNPVLHPATGARANLEGDDWMKSKALITALCFAVANMTAMADVPLPKYYYHALLFPEWLASKAGLPNGLVLWLSLSLAFIVLNYIRVQRKSGTTFLRFVRKQWINNLMICLLCFVGCLVRYFFLDGQPSLTGGRVDVLVKPNPNESYFQYRERARRLENDLCLKCGTKMEHWYDRGRVRTGTSSRVGCPKCDSCPKCGSLRQVISSQGQFVYCGNCGYRNNDLYDKFIENRFQDAKSHQMRFSDAEVKSSDGER